MFVACAERGCRVAVIVESEAESGGTVTFEMSQALGTEVATHATLYTWPSELRPETKHGKRASLHAASDSVWLAGRNAPTLGEDFRVRLSYERLREKASWRVQEIPLLAEGAPDEREA